MTINYQSTRQFRVSNRQLSEHTSIWCQRPSIIKAHVSFVSATINYQRTRQFRVSGRRRDTAAVCCRYQSRYSGRVLPLPIEIRRPCAAATNRDTAAVCCRYQSRYSGRVLPLPIEIQRPCAAATNKPMTLPKTAQD